MGSRLVLPCAALFWLARPIAELASVEANLAGYQQIFTELGLEPVGG